MGKWNLTDIPNLEGKVVIVTGGNIGLGFKSSLEFARAGAEVVIACRSVKKGEQAKTQILKEVPAGLIHVIALDLTDLMSIGQFANIFLRKHQQLDILMNNAGVVNLETLQTTAEGHEMHMATNHFGHFALTGHLFDTIADTSNSRVVTLSSLAYKQGRIVFDDLDWSKRNYDRVKAYGDSKLANLMFTDILQDKFVRLGSDAIAISAHPGLTGTERQQTIGIGGALTRWVASSVSNGVLPQLRAACDPAVRPRDFVGPRFGIRGAPTIQSDPLDDNDKKVALQLWEKTADITGVVYPT